MVRIAVIVQLLAQTPTATPGLFLHALLSCEFECALSMSRRECCKSVAKRPAFAQCRSKRRHFFLGVVERLLHSIVHSTVANEARRVRILGIIHIAVKLFGYICWL